MTKNKLHILHNKNAFYVFSSQLISTVCDKMMSIGLVWYLTKAYSINIVPWFLMVSFLPHIFMSFYASGIINRLGVLKTVIRTEYLRGIILLLLFGTLYVVPDKSNEFLTCLFVAVFLVGVCSSLFNPAILSLPPALVESEEVPAVNAILDTSFSLSNILGAACSIFLLNIFDIKLLILINAISFFVAAILQSRVKMRIVEVSDEDIAPSTTVQNNGPMAVLKRYPMIMRMLLSFLFINVIFTPILVMIPWYVENIFHGNGSDLAMIEGAMGVGAFLTGMYLTMRSVSVSDSKRVGMLAVIFFIFGVIFQIFSFTRNTGEASLMLFLLGAISTFLNVQVLTYFQTALKEEEVPAIMVAVNIISAATMPLSFAISGLLFPIVEVPKFALTCGLLTMLIAFFLPAFLKQKPMKITEG